MIKNEIQYRAFMDRYYQPLFLLCLLTPPIGWFALWLVKPFFWRMSHCEPGEEYIEGLYRIHGDMRFHVSVPSPSHPLYNWAKKFPEAIAGTEGPYR